MSINLHNWRSDISRQILWKCRILPKRQRNHLCFQDCSLSHAGTNIVVSSNAPKGIQECEGTVMAKKILRIALPAVLLGSALFVVGCYTDVGYVRGERPRYDYDDEALATPDSTQEENYPEARSRFYYDSFYPWCAVGFGFFDPWYSPWSPWYYYPGYDYPRYWWGGGYYPSYYPYPVPYHNYLANGSRAYGATRTFGMNRTLGTTRTIGGTYLGGSTGTPVNRLAAPGSGQRVANGRRGSEAGRVAPSRVTSVYRSGNARQRGASYGNSGRAYHPSSPQRRSSSDGGSGRSGGGRSYTPSSPSHSSPSGGGHVSGGSHGGGGSRGGSRR